MSHGDNPISTPDTDRLSRSDTAHVLAALLTDPTLDTPLALGIYGEWGSGKTSVLRLIEHQIQATTTHLTLWFDAWRYAHQRESLWRALLLAVVERLRETTPESEHEHLDSLVERLYRSQTITEQGDFAIDWSAALPLATRGLISLVPLLGPDLARSFRDWLGSDENAENALSVLKREEVEHYRAQVQSLEQFQAGLRDLVETHIGQQQRRLVILVDDLDRCLPEDAVGVLEATKVFLDIPHCVFVFAMDRHVVEQGIRVRYKDFALNAGGASSPVDARQYLDKVIQIPFTLEPLSDQQIRQFIEHWCQDHPDPDLGACAELITTGVAPNPRTVKRTLNVLHLATRLRLAAGQEVAGDDLPRLAVLVVLQTSYEAHYRQVVEEPKRLREWEQAANNPAQRSGTTGALDEVPRLREMLGRGRMFGGLNDDELGKLVYAARLTG